jgi:hypothetical protein
VYRIDFSPSGGITFILHVHAQFVCTSGSGVVHVNRHLRRPKSFGFYDSTFHPRVSLDFKKKRREQVPVSALLPYLTSSLCVVGYQSNSKCVALTVSASKIQELEKANGLVGLLYHNIRAVILRTTNTCTPMKPIRYCLFCQVRM